MTTLTREGHARLERELHEDRVALVQVEEFIRQMLLCKCDIDDLSLREARERKVRLENRVSELQETLTGAEIVAATDDGPAGIGTFASLLDETTGQRLPVQLVSAPEAGVADDDTVRISEESPVGRGLTGKRAGESFTVQAGDGRRVRYRILELGNGRS